MDRHRDRRGSDRRTTRSLSYLLRDPGLKVAVLEARQVGRQANRPIPGARRPDHIHGSRNCGEVDPEHYPNGWFAWLADPEGNPIQLWQTEGPTGTDGHPSSRNRSADLGSDEPV